MAGRSDTAGRQIAAWREVFDQRSLWQAVIALALGQHGIVTATQLIALGLSTSSIQRLTRIGSLHRVHHGVYSVVPVALLKSNGHRMAAVLACGEGAALSHRSAAELHGLAVDRRTRFEVTVPSRAGRSRPGIIVHRSSTLRPCDVTRVDGVPCTTIARTALDVADVRPQRELERLLDEAVALELFDLAPLQEQAEHAQPGRGRAARKLHRALTEHRPGTTRTDGPLGERMLRIIRTTPGLLMPDVQPWIDLGDGEEMIRADFAWREARVILETDGAIHRRGRRVERDIRRDQRAARAGWLTLRFSAAQIRNEPPRIGATLLDVVTSRSSGAMPIAA